MIEEIADLIVQGCNREAYQKMRDHYGLNRWEVRERHLAALAAPVEQMAHKELERRHKLAMRKMYPPPKKETARFIRL